MQVDVLHNQNRHAMLDGYRETDRLLNVFTMDVDQPKGDRETQTLLSVLFDLFNVGDDPEFGEPDEQAIRYRKLGNRSLSVGDVIVLRPQNRSAIYPNHSAYAVKAYGWDSVFVNNLNILPITKEAWDVSMEALNASQTLPSTDPLREKLRDQVIEVFGQGSVDIAGMETFDDVLDRLDIEDEELQYISTPEAYDVGSLFISSGMTPDEVAKLPLDLVLNVIGGRIGNTSENVAARRALKRALGWSEGYQGG